MKSDAEIQAAIDEIKQVCDKHGVILVGTCESEGIFGEITIAEPERVKKEWQGVGRLGFNEGKFNHKYPPVVDAIGTYQ